MKNTPTFIIVPLLCWGIAEALYGCIQLYGLTASNHTLYRLTGSFQNPGPFAGFLATLLPIALWNVVQHKTTSCLTKRISIWLSGICIFLCVSLLPASMSRASWLAAGTSTAVVLASRYRLTSRIGQLFRTHRKQYIACLAAAFLLLALAGGGIYHLKKDSADGRLLMWKITLRIIAAHPLAGVGNGHFAGAYGEAQAAYFASGNASPQEEHVAGSPEYAFNEFLQIGAEHGLPGLALFLSLIAFTLRPSFRKRQPGIAASVVAFLVFSCFSYPFSVWQLQVLFAVLTIDSAAASGNKYITTASLLLFAVPDILSLRHLDSCRYFGVFAHILDQENNGCFIIKDSTQYQLPIDNNYLSMSISPCNLQNDKIYYTYNANYSIIYQIDSEQTIPLYRISYGKDQCQDENYFKNPQADAIAKFKFAFENKAYTGISLNTIVTSRNVCFNYAHKHINLSKLYTAVYNLETKQIKNYSKLTTTGISNAITPKGTYQDFYVSLITPENCDYKKEKIKGELSQQIVEEIETTDFSKELCHPFVVLYKLK